MLLMGATRCRWAAYPLGRYQRGTGREKRRNEPLNGSLRDAPLGPSLSFPSLFVVPPLICVAPHRRCFVVSFHPHGRVKGISEGG